MWRFIFESDWRNHGRRVWYAMDSRGSRFPGSRYGRSSFALFINVLFLISVSARALGVSVWCHSIIKKLNGQYIFHIYKITLAYCILEVNLLLDVKLYLVLSYYILSLVYVSAICNFNQGKTGLSFTVGTPLMIVEKTGGERANFFVAVSFFTITNRGKNAQNFLKNMVVLIIGALPWVKVILNSLKDMFAFLYLDY